MFKSLPLVGDPGQHGSPEIDYQLQDGLRALSHHNLLSPYQGEQGVGSVLDVLDEVGIDHQRLIV